MKVLLLACGLWGTGALPARADDKLRGAPSMAASIGRLCGVEADKIVEALDEQKLPCRDAACRRAAAALCARRKGTSILEAQASRPAEVAVGSWQAALVTGLGNMVADRAKAEVETWFEDLARERLCALSTRGVRWFAETCKLLDDRRGVGQQIATSLIAETMKRDLQHLVPLAAGYLESRLANRPIATAVLAAVPAAVAVAGQLVKGASPLLVVRDAARSPGLEKACVSRLDPKAMTPACALVFAGLAIDHYGAVLEDAMKANGALDLAGARLLVEKVFAAGELACDVTRAMSGRAACDDAARQLVPHRVARFLDLATLTDQATLDELFAAFQDMIDINDLLKAPAPTSPEEMRARLRQLLAELDSLRGHMEALCWPDPPKATQALHRLLQAAVEIAARDYAAAAIALVDAFKLLEVPLPRWASRLLPLIVDLAAAKDSSEVAAAITRAAAPIGSWRLKRQQNLISVTALVGGAIGYEAPRERAAATGQRFEGGLAAGVMAPIGLQLSVPCESWSIGLLASVLDLGQITWTRLQEQPRSSREAGAGAAPDASLAKVFSPGLYLVLGAGHSPFTFGVGASYAPELRGYAIDVGGAVVETDVSVWRFGAFAAIDVTLFPF